MIIEIFVVWAGVGADPCLASYAQAGRECREKKAALRVRAETEAAKAKAAQDTEQTLRQ